MDDLDAPPVLVTRTLTCTNPACDNANIPITVECTSVAVCCCGAVLYDGS